MLTRRLPHTDLDLSVIGMGCWAMGGEASTAGLSAASCCRLGRQVRPPAAIRTPTQIMSSHQALSWLLPRPPC